VVVAPPATYTTQWCEHFRTAGWRVEWIAYAHADDDAVATLPEVGKRRPGASLVLLAQAWRLRRLLRNLDPDLVHTHWITGPAWLLALCGRRPFIATAWGSDALIFTHASPLRRLLARLVGRTAAAVTYDAETIADSLAAAGMPRERLHRIVFGADRDLFFPARPDRSLLRRLGVTNDDPVIISSRGTRAVYEPETVVRGFAAATLRRPCNLLLRVDDIHNPAHATGAAQQSQWEQLGRLAAELGVADRVIPYEGVPREDLPRLLASADVFLSVPNSDGTSVALLEALFAEVPVIVSDLPANREWIIDRSYGGVVPVGDPEQLGAAILGVLENPEAAKAAAARAGVRARQKGDSQTEFARARALYDTVLAEDG
jgi:L-malate glycosyltransferase